jgi:hypothetical protein
MRMFDRNRMQLEEYLRPDDRIALPTGSAELIEDGRHR